MKRSKIEMEFEAIADLYEEKNGESYPGACEDDHPYEYHINRIKESLKTGIPIPEDDLPEDAIH